jgi:hypothetical protein
VVIGTCFPENLKSVDTSTSLFDHNSKALLIKGRIESYSYSNSVSIAYRPRLFHRSTPSVAMSTTNDSSLALAAASNGSDTRGTDLWIVIWIFTIIAMLVVGLKLFTRANILHAFGLDDFFIFVSSVRCLRTLSLALTYLLFRSLL